MNLCVAIIVLTFVLVTIQIERIKYKRAQANFDEKWPPLSNSEFLERCPEDVDSEVAFKVREIISDIYGIPEVQIYPEQSFPGDLLEMV